MINDRIQLLVDEYRLIHGQHHHNRPVFMMLLGFTLATFVGYATASSQNSEIPTWFVLMAPLGVVIPVGILIWMTQEDILLSLYLRALENEIRNELERLNGPDFLKFKSYDGLLAMSSHTLLTEHNSTRRRSGRKGSVVVLSVSGVFSAAGATLVAIGANELYEKSGDPWKVTVYLVFYSLVAAILVYQLYETHAKSRETFESLVDSYNWRLTDPLKPLERTRPTYNAWHIPKPNDLPKGVWGVLGVAYCSTWLDLPPSFPMVISVIYFAIFELLFYQTRYLINDLLGLKWKEDSSQPTANLRGRIPTDVESVARLLSELFIRVLLCMFVLLGFSFVNWSTFIWLAASLLLLAAITIAYEGSKSLEKVYAGRSAQGFFGVCTTAVVGLGYPVRFLVGVGITATLASTPLPFFERSHSLSRLADAISASEGSGLQIWRSLEELYRILPELPCFLLLVYGSASSFVALGWCVEALSWTIRIDKPGRCVAVVVYAEGKYHLVVILRSFLRWAGVRLKVDRDVHADRVGESIKPCEVRDIAGAERSLTDSVMHVIWLLLTPWSIGSGAACFAIVRIVEARAAEAGPGPVYSSLLAAFLWFMTNTCFEVVFSAARKINVLQRCLSLPLPFFTLLLSMCYATPKEVVFVLVLAVMFASVAWTSLLFATYEDTINTFTELIKRIISGRTPNVTRQLAEELVK